MEVHGFLITVYPKRSKWAIAIMHIASKQREYSSKQYATCEEAKLAAFDALLYMESKRNMNADPRLVYREMLKKMKAGGGPEPNPRNP